MTCAEAIVYFTWQSASGLRILRISIKYRDLKQNPPETYTQTYLKWVPGSWLVGPGSGSGVPVQVRSAFRVPGPGSGSGLEWVSGSRSQFRFEIG